MPTALRGHGTPAPSTLCRLRPAFFCVQNSHNSTTLWVETERHWRIAMALSLARLGPHLRRLAGPPSGDQELLDRFALEHDHAAFALLVARHGPLVLHTCGRILGDR